MIPRFFEFLVRVFEAGRQYAVRDITRFPEETRIGKTIILARWIGVYLAIHAVAFIPY